MAEKHSSIQDTTLFSEYTENLSAIEPFHVSFDEKEQIFMGKPIDKITQEETDSKLTDPTLVSAIIKQNNTVMAQMPTGKVTNLSIKNKGKSLFMDMILHKHILPNANTQYDTFTKYWLMSLYRKIYGSMGVLVDYINKADSNGKGYIGADFSLIPIRGIIPQKGKTTIEDSDYIDIRTQVSDKYLKSVAKKDGWNAENIRKVLESGGDSMSSPTYNQQVGSAETKIKGLYEIVTRYYKDTWVTFHPGKKLVLRSIANQHKNNKIPVVMCHAYPLMDRFFGLGDVERGTVLHGALGGLINLYMQGVKMSIFPERLVDPSAVENWGDIIKNGISPGQIWLMGKQDFDGMRQMPINPAGIQSFQSTYSFLKGAMMTLTNTTDTSMDAKIDPGFGKSQRYSEPVLTPTGWTTMGDINIGDLVIDDKGTPAKVLEIHEQGVIDTYDISFMDGSKTNCSLDHLWTVYSARKHGRQETITLKDIIGKGYVRQQTDKRDQVTRNEYLYHVPLTKPVAFVEKPLAIDPYLFGLLLGDGGFSEDRDCISFTNSKSYIQNKIRELLPDGDELRVKKSKRNNEFRIYGRTVDVIKSYGLKGHTASGKFIPTDYLYNSIEKREKLLQGLIDTDGHVLKQNSKNIEFSSVSNKLATGFMELARSLGYYAHMQIGQSSANYKGEKRFYGAKYRVHINGRNKKAIVKIEKSIPELSRCLYVNTPNHLYITTGYTVTHNTPQALKMQAMTQGQQSQFDRRMLELAIEKINDRLIDLVSHRQEKPIELFLGKEDLARVAEVNPDVIEMFETNDMGRVTIKHTEIRDEEYRYDIDQGSTVKKDELVENEGLTEIMEMVKAMPGALEQSVQTGMVAIGSMQINMGELIKRWIITKGVTDWDKIITERKEEPGMEQGMMEQQGMEDNAMNIENPNGMAMAQQLYTGQYQNQDLNDTYAELEALANG